MRSPALLSLLVVLIWVIAPGCQGGDDLGAGDAISGPVSDASSGGDVASSGGSDPGCCPAGVCPLGEYCLDGACHPIPSDAHCFIAGDCEQGQICDGASLCACGDPGCDPVVGGCRWPEGCCNTDLECEGDAVCVLGVCQGMPDDGSCWRDAECKAGQVCEGQTLCACGVDADCVAAPGHCSLPGVCCLTDAECGPEGACVGGGCVVKPDGDRCFANEDCPENTRCVGASVCPCGDPTCVIPTTAGRCTGAEVCCETQADCGQSLICVSGEACVAPPGGNQCWVDDHCGPGRVCQGASLCPCGEFCVNEETLGTCHTVVTPCTEDITCGPAMVCAIPDTAWCPSEDPPTEGVCVAAVDDACWSSDACGPNARCAPEIVCTAAEGCQAPNQPGTCQDFVKDGDCCVSHRECSPDSDCRNANTSITCAPTSTAVCIPKPVYGDTCWNYEDCPPGLVCNQAFVCACNARCWKSHDGYCALPEGQYCKTDIDCGTGYDCARNLECIVNPCLNSNNCPLAGQCQLKQAGKCWGHAGCGEDEFCQGLRVCEPDNECDEPDKPGECAPLQPAGACCDSYYACQPGLRCVSAATKTGCLLDVSSICVPYTQYNITCFTEEDCGPGRVCSSAQMCPCGQQGCDDLPSAGLCVTQ